MKAIGSLSTHALVAVLIAILGVGPEFAWSQENPATTQAPAESQDGKATAAPPSPQQEAPGDLPNSPGSLLAQASAPQPPQNNQPATTAQRPSGTAAAEIGSAAGTPASKPAGIAMAPAKQRQSRSLLIKIGALVGAGVAVGTVFALSKGSPSRPPGSQ